MKYPKEMYLDCGFCDGDMDGSEQCHSEKIVKCRKSHICSACQKEIKAGDEALYETAIVEGMGWCSSYTCLPYIEAWLEESGQVDTEQEGKQ